METTRDHGWNMSGALDPKGVWMPMRFTVLASGSGGNARLLQIDGFGLLLDMGLGPRQLAQRFTLVGVSWDDIQAVVLTHTHSDHWRIATMTHLWRRRIPLY